MRSCRPVAQFLEGCRLGQGLQFAVELELALLKRFSQMDQKSFAEEAAEDFDRKEERIPAGDPARVVRADSAAGHDAVNMRMKTSALTIP